MEWILGMVLVAAMYTGQDPEPVDDNAPKPREIKDKEINPTVTDAEVGKPTKIKDAETLAKIVPDPASQECILDEVDLKKEYLLLFTWSGSGRDTLTFEPKKGDEGMEVVFTYKRGLTRDLRHHVKLFALPKKTKFSVEK